MREYRVLSNDPVAPTTATSIITSVRQRATLVLVASTLAISIQGVAWVARNTQFFARPYVLPVTVFAEVFLGGSIQIVSALKWLFQTAWRAILAFGQDALGYFLGSEWKRGLAGVVFILFQIQLRATIWTWQRFAHQPVSQKKDTTPLPDAGAKPPAVSDSPSKLPVGDVSPKPLSQSQCQAAFLQQEGAPPARLCTGRKDRADFIAPVFGRDVLAGRDRPNQSSLSHHYLNQQEAFAACRKHREQYIAHTNRCKCSAPCCNAVGDDRQIGGK